jgi:hypothetical protein
MSQTEPRAPTKVCPQCAEDVRAAAVVCRYCGFRFESASSPAEAAQATAVNAASERTVNKQYPSNDKRGRGADQRQMLAEGFVSISEGDDGQGHYNVLYAHRPSEAAFFTAAASRGRDPAELPLNSSVAYRAGQVIGVIGIVAAAIALVFVVGGIKPSAGTRATGPLGSDAGGSWPPEFRTGICAGVVPDLRAIGAHLAALQDAATNFDVGRVNDEASSVNERADAAQIDLESLPAWDPGVALVADLRSAVTSYRQGVNLLKQAVSSNDAAGIKAASGLLSTGSAGVSRATSDIVALHDSTGFSCS